MNLTMKENPLSQHNTLTKCSNFNSFQFTGKKLLLKTGISQFKKDISSKGGILKLLFQQLSQKLNLRRGNLPYNRNVNKTLNSCLLSYNIVHQCLI